MLEQDDENVPDLESYSNSKSDTTFPETNATELTPEDRDIPTRTYDLAITYDKYWQTPRLWIMAAFDEDGQPICASSVIAQEISPEHANQTVTVEPFPHRRDDISMVSVHPCKHAAVMKSILMMHNQLTDDENDRQENYVRADQYLIVFLKWMSSVMPTINYDFTMSS